MKRLRIALIITIAAMTGHPAVAAESVYSDKRADMIRVIKRHAFHAEHALGRPVIDPRVLNAMAEVPRHEFLPGAGERETDTAWWQNLLPYETQIDLAYADRPLPIGYGQTISQPFIVALMTDLLHIDSASVVFELGTGSGYQAAVLAPLVRRVCTVEIVPQLGEAAAKRFKRLGYGNIDSRVGDGYYGWEDCGPFDGIVVTAAASHVPPPLVEQLKPGGRMVIPVGSPFAVQQLTLIEKHDDGTVTTRLVLPVRFVPLRRQAR